MASETLLEKFNALVAENETLKKENERLRAQLLDILPSQSREVILPVQSNRDIQPQMSLSEILPSEV